MVLTKRQREVLDFIAAFLRKRGYSPSFQEIAGGMGLNSLATVHKHISTLERKGFLRRGYNQSRSLEPAPRYWQQARQARAERAGLPLLGRIAAGKPVESLPHPKTISLRDFAGKNDVFVLQVKGDSMRDEHIRDGDFIIVEKTSQAEPGDIVLAQVGGSENTLQRFAREPDGPVRLQPANAPRKAISPPAKDVAVQGRVIGVLRRYR
ncbi:MAG: transcriptional repressor LexA [Acidobacteria bacterium]|nr:transcriptional repressor LexA [Acidobacteriota bacterium]